MTHWPRTIAPRPPAAGAPAPLLGLRVLWTRPQEDEDDPLAAALAAAGAEVLVAPAIEFHEMAGDKNLMVMLESLDHLRQWQGWLALPSPSAVRLFMKLLEKAGLTPQGLAGIRIAAIGSGSAAALEAAGMRADFIPGAPNAAGLARELPGGGGTPVLIAGSSRSRPELRDGLKARGFRVQHLATYDTRPCAEGLQALGRVLDKHPETLIAAASPSAIEAVMDWFDARERPRPRARWVAIGPTTRQRLLDAGVPPDCIAQAATPDAAGLIAAAAPANPPVPPPEADAP